MSHLLELRAVDRAEALPVQGVLLLRLVVAGTPARRQREAGGGSS